LSLVGLNIDDEDKGVVLFNFLHGALGVERVDDDFVLIEAGNVRNGFAGVFGRARELEGLGAVESRRETDFADLVRVRLRVISIYLYLAIGWMETYALQSGLSSSIGLLGAFRWLSSTC
jgi:hypothetical protein